MKKKVKYILVTAVILGLPLIVFLLIIFLKERYWLEKRISVVQSIAGIKNAQVKKDMNLVDTTDDWGYVPSEDEAYVIGKNTGVGDSGIGYYLAVDIGDKIINTMVYPDTIRCQDPDETETKGYKCWNSLLEKVYKFHCLDITCEEVWLISSY